MEGGGTTTTTSLLSAAASGGAAVLNVTSWIHSSSVLAAGHTAVKFPRSIKLTVTGGLEFVINDVIPVQFRQIWVEIRRRVIAPVWQAVVIACLVMSVMLLVEAVYMSAVSLIVKFLRRRPEKRYKWEEIAADVEVGNYVFPMVLVQIPMYNEKEVYKLSIGAACGLSWPSDRMIIQVLDDSTDPTVKDLVELECKIWVSKGMNVMYEVRGNRKGYKAGALKEAMKKSYVEQCDYVAIFDADFQPEPDFLLRTVPFLIHNPTIGLVQARWKFVNSKECVMTRIQTMSLDYHFKVEQEAGSSTFAFFGFNGTAGVWRISAINEAGGWKDRTTVEDMDLAVRASLKGWKFVYIGDLMVKSELPSSFKAYRYQQHRWTCGAANLFRKMAKEIVKNKEVSVWKKFHVIYSFFFVRKIVAPMVTFVLYCFVIPISVMVPEVGIPVWGVVHIPTTITLLNAIRNPQCIYLIPLWILFENVMAMHRMKATVIGLFETGNVNEWIVTEKLGDASKAILEVPLLGKSKATICDRIYMSELGFAFFLFFCACYDLTFVVYLHAPAPLFVGYLLSLRRCFIDLGVFKIDIPYCECQCLMCRRCSWSPTLLLVFELSSFVVIFFGYLYVIMYVI